MSSFWQDLITMGAAAQVAPEELVKRIYSNKWVRLSHENCSIVPRYINWWVLTKDAYLSVPNKRDWDGSVNPDLLRNMTLVIAHCIEEYRDYSQDGGKVVEYRIRQRHPLWNEHRLEVPVYTQRPEVVQDKEWIAMLNMMIPSR